MNSDKNEAEKLPVGWILCKSKSTPGKTYYFNRKTGKSSWNQPQVDDEKPEPSKQKSKKEKTKPEKSQKEDERSNLKRKSDRTDDSFSKKKQKQEPPTPEKSYRVVKKKPETSPAQRHYDTEASSISVPDLDIPDSSRKEGSTKCLNTSKKYSPPDPTPTKNLANNRLSQLRAQFNSEAQSTKPEEEKSPVKAVKNKISPQTPHCEAKHPRLDLKSPNFSESKCTTTQSPSSDSFQSIPSPSQFFAANKIISSMKAQLPEEYCNKSKPKDTFAEIEEGICNQTAEYPFMKHPATPPQFSEASKLVSAIKSKLSYKVSPMETNTKQFASANARMDSLRARLSNETMETKNVIENNFLGRIEMPEYSEAMDVEECKETNQSKTVYCNANTKKNVGANGSKENIVLVVDTNMFIHELDVIRNVLNSHIKGYSEQPTLLVPWRVVNELDRLKDNNNGNGAICKRARAAMDYLYKSLPEDNRIKGQSLRDANSHIYPCELPDDEILNCCLQQAERGKSVILLSNDKNLCNKAHINSVKCLALEQLKSLMENKPQPAADPDLYASVKHYENTMYHLLANILENEMRAKYNNLWEHVLFKAPPWTLTDVLQCLLKHWVAVFNEVFPRIEHLITDLRNTLVSINSKDPKSLSQSEMSNFKDLCLEIAKKCQIIPEYMELAKATVERLLRKCASGTDGETEEMVVIDAFEGLWTVFSSYCAKLSSALSISHSIEDKLPEEEPLPVLTRKWPMFSTQINALALAMRGALSVDNAERGQEERVGRLTAVFKDSLNLTRMDSQSVNKDNVRVFCSTCRNMLQEACTKFSELTELLKVCENYMANEIDN